MSGNQEQIETAARAAFEYDHQILKWPNASGGMQGDYRNIARAVIAAIHPTVATETELDALPVGSVILTDGETWRRVYDGATHSVWHGGRHGYEFAQDVIGPESSATVLHVGGAA